MFQFNSIARPKPVFSYSTNNNYVFVTKTMYEQKKN